MNRKRRPSLRDDGDPARPRPRGPRIYTRTGDRGETGLLGGQRVPKDHGRVEAYGAIDELNSHLGLVRAQLADPELTEALGTIQNRLFDLGAELATPSTRPAAIPAIGGAHVEALERMIDRYQDELAPLREFILPGGTVFAASLHVARTVARRAERRIVTLARTETVNPELLRYMNRLSDLLFVLARVVNHRNGRPDVAWTKTP